MTKIVVSEFMDETALADFPVSFSVEYDVQLVDDRERLCSALADAEALIVRNRTQVDAALLECGPKLRCIGRLGVGLDNIDVQACTARSVAVYPASGANTLSVVEYVVSSALQLVRGAYASNAQMLAGQWPRSALIGGELAGRTLGLIGYGGIARAVAGRMKMLGMEIAAFDPVIDADDACWAGVQNLALNDLLDVADVVSLHVPLLESTRHIINSDALSRMKNSVVLINTARGGTVDDAAIADALRSGSIAGAALDVFETEPLTQSAAQIFEGLQNLILTPHIAGVTDEGNVRVSYLTVKNVLQHLRS